MPATIQPKQYNLQFGLFKNESFLRNEQNALASKKQKFLDSIISSNGNGRQKYKRFVSSPIRYAGGKSLGVGFIIELLPNNIQRIVSPFFGGGSVEIACSQYLDLEVVGFDIFDILVNYWQVQINSPDKLFQKLNRLKPDRGTYKKIKDRLNDHWKNRTALSPVNLAAHYYFNHNLSYGPGFLGWPSSVYMNEVRYEKMIKKVREFSPGKLEVKKANFEEVFKKYPSDFFYCDPPYLLGKDSKMFAGIYPQRNFPVHHKGFEHEKLRDLLKKHRGGFILSYNDCGTVRDWYKDYQQYFPVWQYTMGQGEIRIGENRKNGNGDHVKASHEIIIFCPPKKS